MSELRECPKCEGTGYVDAPGYECGDPLCGCSLGTKCDECDGLGEVEDPRWTLTDLGRAYRAALEKK